LTASTVLLFAEIKLKISLKSVIVLILSILFLAIWPRSALASNSIKPQLTWQRSREAPDKIVTETIIGSKLNEALNLPPDSNQQVFDNGLFTPQINKDHVQSGVQWSSWKQYSASPSSCGPIFELRHFQAKFNLASKSNIQSIRLSSPYYPNNTFPINDNGYIYLNGHFVTRLGTSYSATSLGFNGNAPYANETDGWIANGNLGAAPAQFLQVGENTLDIVAGETCRWGGMGRLELVIEQSAPEPFLDLPWDYQAQGKSFEQVALDPFSWFDHQYPLQDQCCDPPVMSFIGKTIDAFYRSHNGYDYSSKDSVFLNTPVLAAAAGWATFKSEISSGGAGNVIKIDHGNGYQTWYEHLQKDGLVLSDENNKVFVNKGQPIGKVGMTGNTNGPHIHFSVFLDRDGDGSFDDELPFGVTDPLGWEGLNPDPWTTDKGGALSFNLFKARQQPQSVQIPTSGGSLNTNKVKINVPAQASNQQFNLSFNNGPFESISNFITSVVPSFFLKATNNINQPVTQFSNPIGISYDYSSAGLSNINEDSLRLYSFNEQAQQWDPITTTLDKINKIASGETLHFSQFALMGEIKDLISPSTQVIITGDKGYNDWYRSDVTVQLIGEDNENGIGLQYTLYTLNDNDWYEYKEPLIFSKEGDYKVTYQSFDKAENTEERKSIEFHVDKTPPQVSIEASPTILWPPNGKIVDVTIVGSSLDDYIYSTKFQVSDEYNQLEPQIDGFGQVIQLEAQRNGSDIDGRTYTIKVIAEDLARNTSLGQVVITVPHDEESKEKY
jgi:murein DD-endopeptidase MepM/ murein hydrolase activator NlpD